MQCTYNPLEGLDNKMQCTYKPLPMLTTLNIVYHCFAQLKKYVEYGLVLSCLVLSRLVLSCLVLPCLALSCRVLSGATALSCNIIGQVYRKQSHGESALVPMIVNGRYRSFSLFRAIEEHVEYCLVLSRLVLSCLCQSRSCTYIIIPQSSRGGTPNTLLL
jgi:hypothetical protein